ncbi:MAG: hypothetical protein A3B99_00635 [Candidatus Yanofskybacteria bacterium RIFCSPHIGHO2_02_FULL_44_12b]|uniref:Major facilitator superfamily n=2 Tax=Candidatus Yanofskyibacteriota TaxID=1752733 RepID=A0A0G1KD36_9BACT|nr:MAG: Major facilitator superfamily [Candidatus Yanofskybacteria bacterium GW2011_GWA2_44_9]OGN05125.1 MAG: hypothetical protein A2659_02195 [Candidatus Yanofskybacteria bacterium RIFCSPHIGHO2_01_FULL_44_24]OGN15986.1 MAG: hypothetical protein A3B99_00635 [Candidatus Yanofskybacteria bacterium RIFCSPHIGHO2_02_FULL_44_12b]
MSKTISAGVKLLTLSTSVRWFGWGLGEAFLPIFILLFSSGFLETGFLVGIYNLTFFISIPLAGYLADRYHIKLMLLSALAIYVLIGLGYWAAGLFGMVIFIILSRGLNGISYALDQIGRESYIIRHSSKERVSSVFGRFDFITNFWWVAAVIIGLILVKSFNVEIHWLLFFIVPTSIASFFIILFLKEEKNSDKKPDNYLKAYFRFFHDINKFNTGIKIILSLSFLIGIISSVIYFFVPISSYLDGNGLVNSAVLAMVYTIPVLFSRWLGKISDKYKGRVYLFGFFSIIGILTTLIFTKDYFIMLAVMFVSSGIFELLSLTNRGMIARFADRTHIGETDGSLNGISALGAMAGPVLFGFLLDVVGRGASYIVIITMPFIALAVIVFGDKYIRGSGSTDKTRLLRRFQI